MTDLREAFDSIDGVISQARSKDKMPYGIVLEFLDKDLCASLSEIIHLIDANFCEIKCVMATGSDVMAIDYKLAGKRLGSKMKEVAAQFNQGDVSGLLDEEIKLKNRFSDGLTAYNGTIRIKLLDGDIAGYEQALDFRRSLKRYITEVLGYNIVPNIWRAPDEPSENLYILSVVLCDCKESLYQSLERWASLVFKNTLMNFRLATRREIYNNLLEPSHHLNGSSFSLSCKIHGSV